MANESVDEILRETLKKRFKPQIYSKEYRYGIYLDDRVLYIVSIRGDQLIIDGPAECQETNLGKLLSNYVLDVLLKLSTEDILSVFNGRETLSELFMTGNLRIAGSLAHAIHLSHFFPNIEDSHADVHVSV